MKKFSEKFWERFAYFGVALVVLMALLTGGVIGQKMSYLEGYIDGLRFAIKTAETIEAGHAEATGQIIPLWPEPEPTLELSLPPQHRTYLTRIETAKILVDYFGLPQWTGGAGHFVDISNRENLSSVQAVFIRSIMIGTKHDKPRGYYDPEVQFDPDDPLTKEQLTLILARLTRHMSYSEENDVDLARTVIGAEIIKLLDGDPQKPVTFEQFYNCLDIINECNLDSWKMQNSSWARTRS